MARWLGKGFMALIVLGLGFTVQGLGLMALTLVVMVVISRRQVLQCWDTRVQQAALHTTKIWPI